MAKTSTRSFTLRKRAAVLSVALLSTAALSSTAHAQQRTFHLDRLEVPGAPDDGLVLFRPVVQQQKTTFFAQFALGYSARPLHSSDIVSGDTSAGATILRRSPGGIIQDQLTSYLTAGFQLFDRLTLSATLPITWVQDGNNLNYGIASTKTTTYDTSGPAAGDTRLDIRGILYRTQDHRGAVGAQLSIYVPTGGTNFGGDGEVSALVMVNGEYTIRWLTLIANTGIAFRPRNSINDPVDGSGLGVSNEWRWAVGALVPIHEGKYRVGATIFGQTGLSNDNIVGNTIFTSQNTPIEWNVEGRMKFGPKNRWWVGVGAGSRIANGYGAPDFRAVALVGSSVAILDSEAAAPDKKAALHAKWKHEGGADRDHDGIPDDIDACPDEPEDHKGDDPNDGCPMPPDRDGDGIPDQFDKCPDVPEDKDGIDDADGCPEDDADQDGIPDVTDACPKEPGSPNPDPKKNGCPSFIKLEEGQVRVLQQVHFAFGSATILPDSFPMLQEIANLLKVNPQIKKMSVEGHTDNRGADELNMRLSGERASSVMVWLTNHGVEQSRLEAHGYGKTRPIADNGTDEGRLANRRVEFKIESEDNANVPPKK